MPDHSLILLHPERPEKAKIVCNVGLSEGNRLKMQLVMNNIFMVNHRGEICHDLISVI